MLALVVGVGACLGGARVALAAESVAERFQPGPHTDLPELERVLVESSPDLEQAQLRVDIAHTSVRQSRLIPNPRLDLSWATIPVGTLNPADLTQPLANVPNYGIGIAFPIQLGKRGPRIRQAKALERGAGHELEALTRARALDLAQTLGNLATASLRVDGFGQVVEDMQRTVEAAQQRVSLSYGVALDVDRLQIELARARSLVLAARSDVASAQAECATQLGKACDAFESGEAARAYLETWIDAVELEAVSLERRPDLAALNDYANAARASAKLARAQAIPDPTVRLGYLHDRFVIAGNQLNSLAVSLSFELPTFDRGQFNRDAAIATELRLTAERSKRITAASAQLSALAERAELERERRRALRDEAIPVAKQVVTSVDRAAEQRLVSVAENVQARRVLRELLLEEADAYAAAYTAQIALLRVRAPEGSQP
jgi:cobalt-zinc-cadmium efflux system outer membrane protein